MRWRILALLFATRVGLGLQFQTVSSVSDDLIAAYGMGYADVGALIGLFMAPGVFLALPTGFAGRVFSDRAIAATGLGALALGGVLAGAAPESWVIGVGRTVAGVGFVLATLYLTKMTADWFVGREIATAMSVLVMSWPFGIAIGQVGYEWIADALGWRWPFFAASAYCALGGVALLAFFRPPSRADVAPAPARSAGLSARELRLVLFAAVAWGVFNAGYVVYLTFAPLMLETIGTTAFAAAAVISVGSWVMILSGALCGHVSDRTGKPDLILTVCILGAAAALLLLSVDGAGLGASLLFGLVGMAPAGVIMALSGDAMRPENRALGMGVFFTVYYAIMAAAPPLAGRIYDATGRPFDAILLGVLFFALVIPANALFRLAQARGALRIA